MPLFSYWHKADIQLPLENVRYRGQSGHGEFQSRRTRDRVKTRDGRSTISHPPRAGFDARGSTVSNSSRTKMELRLVNWKHAENGGVELDNGAV
jgi:hypothetical protein